MFYFTVIKLVYASKCSVRNDSTIECSTSQIVCGKLVITSFIVAKA